MTDGDEPRGSSALRLMHTINRGEGLPDHAGLIRFAAVLLQPVLAPRGHGEHHEPIPPHP